ncbi:MAG: PD-(D/E)XK nuclease family protein [Bacteroidota bacterium]
MDQPFLSKLAEKIRSEHAGLGNRLCVVMPNRRAGLFLKRYLVAGSEVPVWAPSVFSVEDFIAGISHLSIPDPLSLMFGLYEAHCSVEKENAVVFDDFTGWSKGLLRDFDEIDQYLVDPAALFGFLSENKAMNLWNMDGQPLTDFEQQYLRFFNALPLYYKHFIENLLKTGQAYHGLACRLVAESPEKYLTPLPWDYVIFAGFNAITPAQITIIRHLISLKSAEIVWDADSYYIENPAQEAGRFLRNYLKDKSLGKPAGLSRFFENGQKEIHLAGVPRNIGQTRLAGNILKHIIENNEPGVLNRTAVVLADETLLLPLLNAIPAEAGQFNITMGYPLQQSPLYGFFDALISMHINASPGKEATQSYFYFKDVLSLIQHPYTSLLIKGEQISRLTTAMKSVRTSFPDVITIFRNQDPEDPGIKQIKTLFSKVESPSGLTGLIIAAVEMFRNAGKPAGDPDETVNSTDGEILFSLAMIANRLHTLVSGNNLIGELRTLQVLFREAAAAMPVPFYGEPLEGIQVMGMLETRTLDFENVILVSTNEDTLPSKKTYNSFIPFEIRQSFGLPTHHDQQAVFAYHFYRLLQRCSKAWLIYNSEADELGGGEKSRFISQLITEMPSVNPDIKVTEIKPSATAGIRDSIPIIIDKSPEVLEKLKQIAKTGFSPTSVNSYIACQLRFYFTYILGLGEPDEAEETIDHRTLGMVIHEVLQKFYEPFIGTFPGPTDYRRMQDETADAIKAALNKHFPGGDVEHGRNLLIVKVANVWISRFLDGEYKDNNLQAGNRILALEAKLHATIEFEVEGNNIHEISIKGFADRIDLTNGIVRIIDYKTGKTTAIELKPKTVEALFESSLKPKEKAFQLLFYLLLAAKDKEFPAPKGNSQAGIISFRSLSDGFIPLVIPGNDVEAAIQAFENGLKNLMSEIYNKEIPFIQTIIREHCSLCPFQSICHKTEEKKAW